MTVGELLASPGLWIAFGACFVAGWFVKRDLFGALLYGTAAPPVLFLVNVVVQFALSIPAFVISKLAPRLWASAIEAFTSMTELLQILLHPSVFVTGGLFVIFCWRAREGEAPASVSPYQH